MDADNFWVADKDDTPEDRHYWRCKRCPFRRVCSHTAWENVKTWSFISEQDVRDSVYSHLVDGPTHTFDFESSRRAAESAEIEFLKETSSDRVSHRRWVAKQERKQTEAGEGGICNTEEDRIFGALLLRLGHGIH